MFNPINNNDLLKKLQKLAKLPEGTITFPYTNDKLFDSNSEGGIILEFAAGAHVFRIERDSKLRILFYYSSPGTGTRVAIIDLKSIIPSKKIMIIFTWSPSDITLNIGPLDISDKDAKGQLVSAKGIPSSRQFRVGEDGGILQIGDEHVNVMECRIYQGGKSLLKPNAIEVWKNTVEAIRVLFSGSSKETLFERVVTNLTLSILVTGFESFCKTRFLELEREGIKPNQEALILNFFSKAERDAGEPDILISEAKNEHKIFLEKMIEKRINFQNYNNCKAAFNKAYEIKFGEIGVVSDDLAFLQQLIRYRHRVIHISPLLGLLNQPEVPPEKPVFANNELGKKALECFNLFITKLHDATLNLKVR